jgi:hypothetical protein
VEKKLSKIDSGENIYEPVISVYIFCAVIVGFVA